MIYSSRAVRQWIGVVFSGGSAARWSAGLQQTMLNINCLAPLLFLKDPCSSAVPQRPLLLCCSSKTLAPLLPSCLPLL